MTNLASVICFSISTLNSLAGEMSHHHNTLFWLPVIIPIYLMLLWSRTYDFANPSGASEFTNGFYCGSRCSIFLVVDHYLSLCPSFGHCIICPSFGHCIICPSFGHCIICPSFGHCIICPSFGHCIICL